MLIFQNNELIRSDIANKKLDFCILQQIPHISQQIPHISQQIPHISQQIPHISQQIPHNYAYNIMIYKEKNAMKTTKTLKTLKTTTTAREKTKPWRSS
jgi:hypothetical protein